MKKEQKTLVERMAELGRKTSPAKAASSRRNGNCAEARIAGALKGGRPPIIAWTRLPDGRWRGERDGISAEGKNKTAVSAKIKKAHDLLGI